MEARLGGSSGFLQILVDSEIVLVLLNGLLNVLSH